MTQEFTPSPTGVLSFTTVANAPKATPGQIGYDTTSQLYYHYYNNAWIVMPGQSLGYQLIGANTPTTGLHDAGAALSFTMPTVIGLRKVELTLYISSMIHGTAPTLHDLYTVVLAKSDNTQLVSTGIVAHGVYGAGYHNGAALVAVVSNTQIVAGAATVKARCQGPTGTCGISSTESYLSAKII